MRVLRAVLNRIFARNLLKSVRDVTQTLRNIDYKDLSVRIHRDNVDRELKDLVDALNEMMSRLEKSFKHIAEFSSHVSHELKTPLAILRGETELALRSENSAKDYHRVIQSNLEEITRMSKIIEDLLLLTKLDYQPNVFKFHDIDAVEFFREIGEAAKVLAETKKISVDLRLPRESVPFRGDKTHLRRLFFNLINNAVKFTPAEGNIGLHVLVQSGEILVFVKDNGIGIPPENIDRVFEQFFHFDGQNSHGVPGNGLGLSIAQSIAKVHSGDIQVQSIVGQGSTFAVRLPLASAAATI